MMNRSLNTRLICPYSLPTHDKKVVDGLLNLGVDCLRFNLQITKETEIQKVIDQLDQKTGDLKTLRVLDLFPSARARTDAKQNPNELKFDQKVVFSNHIKPNSILFHSQLADSIFIKGKKVFLGYGEVILATDKVDVEGDEVTAHCRVLQAGTVTENMAIHVPDSRPTFSKEDYFGVNKTFDQLAKFAKNSFQAFILPSYFPQEKITDLRSAFFERQLPSPWLIQKIDHLRSFERMNSYCDSVEGFLVSRRELSLSADPATVPMLTKEIFRFCKENAKVVFTASEILGSMRYKSSPTRAEVSDLANAVADGTDGIVISEEIPMGERRLKSMKLAQRVISDVEADTSLLVGNWEVSPPKITNEMDAIAIGSLRTARRVGAKAIVCITHSGNTALKLSSFKSTFPILSITFDKDIANKLRLIRGIQSITLESPPKIDNILDSINAEISKLDVLKKGDSYVFVSVTLSSVGQQNSNLFSVQKLHE